MIAVFAIKFVRCLRMKPRERPLARHAVPRKNARKARFFRREHADRHAAQCAQPALDEVDGVDRGKRRAALLRLRKA